MADVVGAVVALVVDAVRGAGDAALLDVRVRCGQARTAARAVSNIATAGLAAFSA